MTEQWLQQVKFNDQGLIAAIAQCANTKTILMQAWMNKDALLESVNTGVAVYWSRSRSQLWRKGEQSGHTQIIKKIMLDCDNDSILLLVEQIGDIACHTGRQSCYYQELTNIDNKHQWQATQPILKDPDQIYK